MRQGKKMRGTGSDEDEGSASGPGDEKVPLETILAFLAERPDLDGLLAEYPQLTVDDLQSSFARAGAKAKGARTVRRRKSAHQIDMVRTHGLPDPDRAMHKGNIFRAILGQFKPGRLLDLGAGKGNFSISASALGWKVTAVDARTMRWPDIDEETDPETAAHIRSITWVQADVREFPIERDEYDLICILGLLHHLQVPDQIDLLRRSGGTPLIIDTRIAPAILDREGPYEGMVIREHGQTREERDQVPTASWGNPVSFRHTEDSLLRLARDSGYALVLQARPPHRRDYTFYLCLPKPIPAHRRLGSLRPLGR